MGGGAACRAARRRRGEADLIDIGHGTVLAGRYRLTEQGVRVPSVDPGRSSVWLGVDQALDRPVELLLLDPAHPQGADVLDAARRAALVDDPRLARVLDVGTDRLGVYVVTERLAGKDLGTLTQRGPLTPETARRIAGEAADALDVARRRGLHHLCLTPRHVVVLADGSVRIRGLAVDAAVSGRELDAADAAARLDTLDLARLLYLGLTGRWPGRPVAGTDAAPVVAGRPVPPGDLAGTVPVELDRLCRTMLGADDGGPRSPAELAAALSPWATPSPVRLDRALDPSGPVRPATGELPVLAAEPGFDELAFGRRDTAPSSTPSSTSTPVAPAAEVVAAPPGPPPVPFAERVRPVLAGIAGRFSRPERATAPREDVAEAPVDWQADPWQEPEPVPDQRPEPPRSGGLFGGGDPRSREDGDARALGPVWESAEADAPLGPLGPEVPLARPPQQQTRVVLVLVGLLVLFGLLAGLLGLRGLGAATSSLLGSEENAPLVQPSVTAPAAPSASPSASPSGTPVVVPSISGISPIDPQGDGEENDDRATRAIDGKTSTSWQSKTYRSAGFGNLKDGLGLVLELEQAAPVTSVTVDLEGTGGAVELRTTTQQEDVEGTTVVARAEPDGSGRVVLTPAQPVTSELLLLWFTELPEVDGGYRAQVSEVSVR